jgi:hypothetical protein
MPSRYIIAGLELEEQGALSSGCLLCRCRIAGASPSNTLRGRRAAVMPLSLCRQGRRRSRPRWTQQQPPARLPRSGWQPTGRRTRKRRQLLRPPETR